jgi:Ca2+-binding RTX toxin-like protein
MNQSPATNRGFQAILVVLLLCAFGALTLTSEAEARPKKCFGKKINRVVSGKKKTVRLAYRDVAWIAAKNVTVRAKPNSTICAGRGRQVIYAGKGTSLTDAGPGNDKIVMNDKSVHSKAYGGLGNDLIIGSRGHDKLYGSPKKVPAGVADTDRIEGNGGNDKIWDYGGSGNELLGEEGSDTIYSLGKAVSDMLGGNGADFLYSNGGKSKDGALERLFGEQGNDRLYANQPNNQGAAYIDGGEGDDLMYGTPSDDIIIYNSGIKKVFGEGGDDLFVTSGRGQGTFDGGEGSDTISFAAHSPTEDPRSISGVEVDLQAGTSSGYSDYALSGIENVIGSAFDDDIKGAPGVDNEIQGGIGDDVIEGQDGDTIDGGLGQNECTGGKQVNCNDDSPGNPGRADQVDITEGGVLTVIGSERADNVTVGYDRTGSQFEVDVAGGALPSGLCTVKGQDFSRIYCPVDRNNMNGMLIFSDEGDDQIRLGDSIPATLTTTINGGTGNNTITGGPSKDFISTAPGSAGSTLSGGDGLDLLYAVDDVHLIGGGDTDIFRVVNPCLAADLTGNDGQDSVVFAGAPRGVKADLAGGYAEWNDGGCPGPRISIAKDIEKLEGTDYDDYLIVGQRNSSQQGRSVLFGRAGIDTFDSRNGSADTVTTGAGGHQNTVYADKIDTVTWGYGLAGH